MISLLPVWQIVEAAALSSTLRMNCVAALGSVNTYQQLPGSALITPVVAIPTFTTATASPTSQGRGNKESSSHDMLKQTGIALFGIVAMAIGTVGLAAFSNTDSTRDPGQGSPSGSNGSNIAAADVPAVSSVIPRYYVQQAPMTRPLPWVCPVRAH